MKSLHEPIVTRGVSVVSSILQRIEIFTNPFAIIGAKGYIRLHCSLVSHALSFSNAGQASFGYLPLICIKSTLTCSSFSFSFLTTMSRTPWFLRFLSPKKRKQSISSSTTTSASDQQRSSSTSLPYGTPPSSNYVIMDGGRRYNNRDDIPALFPEDDEGE